MFNFKQDTVVLHNNPNLDGLQKSLAYYKEQISKNDIKLVAIQNITETSVRYVVDVINDTPFHTQKIIDITF